MKINHLAPILLCLTACGGTDSAQAPVRFSDVTDEVGLRSEASFKYGGPTLADLNNDGRYDFALTNHNEVPAQLFYATEDKRFLESSPIMRGDVHGIAAGDYDQDGLVDLVVSLGGGNGTTPQPPRLLKNTGGTFEDVTVEAGIAGLGARGRSVRWIDLDTDGDLDLLEIVAQQLATETGPRNILFENLGDGTFQYRESPGFEDIEAERVLITDIDNDHVPDLVTFTPLRIMKGDNNFGFSDVTAQWLADIAEDQREHAMAVSEADIDNDGDMDLYVARGKTYYEAANNSVELNGDRMNLRDEGNAGQDFIEFDAGEEIGLADFYHWPRGVDITLPVYLGNSEATLDTPQEMVTVTSIQATGFPEPMEENGWYLGYLGDGRWKLGWNLNGDLAWDLRASVTGVTQLHPRWEPQVRDVQDLLLVNEGDHYRDASDKLPVESGHNNWGVITGDFDNDADSDFFVWRFGHLIGRVPDVLLTNDGNNFAAFVDHGATNLEGGGHGDMGAPFDYDGDGWLDILSGSDDQGYWNLFRNEGGKNNSITIRIGNSPGGVGAHDASVSVSSVNSTQTKYVRSAGAVHSQGLNNLVHFGLGSDTTATTVLVRWRDGTETVLENVAAGTTHEVGEFTAPQTLDFSFLDENLPMDERVELLVSQMKAAEKISQLVDEAAAIPRLKIPDYGWWNEALHGVARNGEATIFPQVIGLGATFDVELTEKVAAAISTEARAKYAIAQDMGNHGKYAGLTFWSPNINIFRDPRWGRGQETFGEDPLLTSRMGIAFVNGLQGDDPKYLKATAAAKHFLVHSGPENIRHEFDAVPSKLDLAETYMPAFEALVTEARVEGVMPAYNAVYGEPMVANSHFLQDVLRKQWGFDGYITSDCGAVSGVARSHKFTATMAEAAAVALKAGTNLNCGTGYKHLAEALAEGLITEELLHERTKQLFKTRFRLGMFDSPDSNPYSRIGSENIRSDEHVALAREAARKSIVLLKNENNILPLSKDTRVPYLTGPFANSADMLMGSYYGVSPGLVTILEGVAAALSPGTSLNYRSGALPFHDNINPKNYAPFVAGYSDVTIAVVGLTADREGEEVDAIASDHEGDKHDLQLPANQIAYIEELVRHKKEKPLVLIVASGSPVSLEGIEEHCDAILQIWYPGEQGGNAVADVLFGDYSPSGHLPMTFPKSVDQLPPYEDYSMKGRTYKYMTDEPAYPFGFGLTYSSTEFSNIRLSNSKPTQDQRLRVEVDVANVGDYDIEEVVQVYVSPAEHDGSEPLHSLKAFQRIALSAGEEKTVTFVIDPDSLLVVNENGDRIWRRGEYKITAGNSSPGTLSVSLGAAKPQEAELTLN